MAWIGLHLARIWLAFGLKVVWTTRIAFGLDLSSAWLVFGFEFAGILPLISIELLEPIERMPHKCEHGCSVQGNFALYLSSPRLLS